MVVLVALDVMECLGTVGVIRTLLLGKVDADLAVLLVALAENLGVPVDDTPVLVLLKVWLDRRGHESPLFINWVLSRLVCVVLQLNLIAGSQSKAKV